MLAKGRAIVAVSRAEGARGIKRENGLEEIESIGLPGPVKAPFLG
jgi:hypothetical protein